MLKTHALILVAGLGIGVFINNIMTTPAQVDYKKLQNIIAASVKSEMGLHQNSVPPSKLSIQTAKNSTTANTKSSIKQNGMNNELLLEELKYLFAELSLELQSSIQNSSTHSGAQANNADSTEANQSAQLTAEQLAKQGEIIQRAHGYLGEAFNRGVWDATDVENLRNLTAKLPASESVKIHQQLLAAMNDGRVNTNLGPMDLF